jgi:hypothetical protein
MRFWPDTFGGVWTRVWEMYDSRLLNENLNIAMDLLQMLGGEGTSLDLIYVRSSLQVPSKAVIRLNQIL